MPSYDSNHSTENPTNPASKRPQAAKTKSLDDMAMLANYSLLDTLKRDPDSTLTGKDHDPREVFSGHYVPVNPTPIQHPEYVAHGKALFQELNFDDSLAHSSDFMRMFSGDLAHLPEPMRKVGWACGYALSIYGTEYDQQCPFQTGNGYGDGRAMSVLELVANGKRWEMQLKGGGRTPYCRGGDGRAVLRSSVREFLAQEHMHALEVPTSRSLSLYVSKTEQARRPWYSEDSRSINPDILVQEPVAISTRVAPSFIRVGQLELFSRRTRKGSHPAALEELEQIVLHLIDREYADEIDPLLTTPEKVIELALLFRARLTSLVAHWIRVGYCQGNFNSDNCAAGGFTLDYGPFGFCDAFDPAYQPWTGGGQHFSFLNQPVAAERNFYSFCSALQPLLVVDQRRLKQLIGIQRGFAAHMQTELERMWASKLGLDTFDESLFSELVSLMTQTPVDYTMFFRELSSVPVDITPLKKSFYTAANSAGASIHSLYTEDPVAMDTRWSNWLAHWHSLLNINDHEDGDSLRSRDAIAQKMQSVNPKYSLREWFVVPAYQQAKLGDYRLIHELQTVMTQPYAEQSKSVEEKYYRLKPSQFFEAGGWSHYSCSS